LVEGVTTTAEDAGTDGATNPDDAGAEGATNPDDAGTDGATNPDDAGADGATNPDDATIDPVTEMEILADPTEGGMERERVMEGEIEMVAEMEGEIVIEGEIEIVFEIEGEIVIEGEIEIEFVNEACPTTMLTPTSKIVRRKKSFILLRFFSCLVFGFVSLGALSSSSQSQVCLSS